MIRFLLLLALASCGNVTRPLAYTDPDAPIVALPPLAGNEISVPPVAANSRIRSGL